MHKIRNKGFTLIEMLVTIIIMGILASIALPQYQQSVLKTRYMKLIPVVKALKQAEEEYFLMHRDYAYDFDELSFSFKGATGHSTTSEGACQRGSVMHGRDFNIHIYEGNCLPYVYGELLNNNGRRSVGFLIYLDYNRNANGVRSLTSWSSRRYCYAFDHSEKMQKLCASLTNNTPEEGWSGDPRFRFQN